MVYSHVALPNIALAHDPREDRYREAVLPPVEIGNRSCCSLRLTEWIWSISTTLHPRMRPGVNPRREPSLLHLQAPVGGVEPPASGFGDRRTTVAHGFDSVVAQGRGYSPPGSRPLPNFWTFFWSRVGVSYQVWRGLWMVSRLPVPASVSTP